MKEKFINFRSLSYFLILTVLLSLISFSSVKAEVPNRTVISAYDSVGSGADCDQDAYCHKIDPGSDSGSYMALGPIVSFSVKAGSNLITYTPP